MVLIIGGAWQGKTEFAKRLLQIEDADICNIERQQEKTDADICNVERQQEKTDADVCRVKRKTSAVENNPALRGIPDSIRAIAHYEQWIRMQYEAKADPVEELHRLLNRNSAVCLIADEVGRGVVPINRRERAARDVIGRTLVEAAKMAEQVYRVTCGIGERIK